MKCANCQTENAEGAKFCSECGESLQTEKICRQCGKSNPLTGKFCNNCGNSLLKEPSPKPASPEPSAEPPIRKIVAEPPRQARMYIPNSIITSLPVMVSADLSKMTPEDQGVFLERYKRKKKSTGLAYFLWFIIGFHYLYLGKVGLQILHWLTAGGLGIWWLIDLFRMPGIVREYNEDAATNVMRVLKMTSSPAKEIDTSYQYETQEGSLDDTRDYGNFPEQSEEPSEKGDFRIGQLVLGLLFTGIGIYGVISGILTWGQPASEYSAGFNPIGFALTAVLLVVGILLLINSKR